MGEDLTLHDPRPFPHEELFCLTLTDAGRRVRNRLKEEPVPVSIHQEESCCHPLTCPHRQRGRTPRQKHLPAEEFNLHSPFGEQAISEDRKDPVSPDRFQHLPEGLPDGWFWSF